MKVALVHDYLFDSGGAERVLEVLCEMYPEAPIYTAFCVDGSTAQKQFAKRRIIESKLAPLLKWKKLYSPLRFLAPWVWEGFDFSDYDVVISSASWYITKGIVVPDSTVHVCYCHTPPRYLYGYPTAVEWQRYWPVRVYGQLIGKFLRHYDYAAAQRVGVFVVNSRNVQDRVQKLYGRQAEIICPPVAVSEIIKETKSLQKARQQYYLIVSRVVGSKGIGMAIEAAKQGGFSLKVVGEPSGLRWGKQWYDDVDLDNVEFLGRVADDRLWKVYAQAKGFLALAEDEDFGMTVVEAMAAGTGVVAFQGGGYKETILAGKTGVFFDKYSAKGLLQGIVDYERHSFQRVDLVRQARKFGKEQFVSKMRQVVGESVSGV